MANEDKLNEKVADTDWELGGDHYAGETNLGDFATDAIYWQVSHNN